MFHARPARRVRAYRPRLEILEDRTLPSTFLVATWPMTWSARG
jgi:hypothetical protein